MIFNRIIDWPYHPQLVLGLSFVICFFAALQTSANLIASLFVAGISFSFLSLILIIPYIILIGVLALICALVEVIKAETKKHNYYKSAHCRD